MTAILAGPLQGQTPKTVNIDNYISENDPDTLESDIESAIIEAGDGGTVRFGAKVYRLSGRVNVNRKVTFRGVELGELPTFGAGPLESTIDLRENENACFQIETDDVKFENLSLRGDYSSTALQVPRTEPPSLPYKGIEITNVNFNQVNIGIDADSGLGLTCTSVTFRFAFRGFALNRSNRSATAPKVVFDKCRFIPEVPERDSIRAISFDAGNDEYPVVWDIEDSEIKYSLFDDCGIATSKCSSLTMTYCEFRMHSYADAPIHIEEFSNNLNYSYNTFDLEPMGGFPHEVVNAGSRQPSNGITLRDNTVKGKGAGFYAQGAASDLIVSENIFSEFEVTDSEKRVVHLYGGVGCRDIRIRNNEINEITAGMVFEVSHEDDFEEDIIINQAPESIKKKVVPGYQSLLDNGRYRIKSLGTGRYLSAPVAPTTGNPYPLTAQTIEVNQSTSWDVINEYPGYIIIQNVSTKAYLEVEKGANGKDVEDQVQPGTYARTANYTTDVRRPIFLLEERDSDEQPQDGSLVLLPGGNEDKTMLKALNGAAGRTEVVLAKITENESGSVTRENNNRWIFEPVQ